MDTRKWAASAAIILALVSAKAQAVVAPVYDSIPNPYPYNLPSLGYQATQTSQFGDEIAFSQAGTLTTVRVGMSSWALASNWPALAAIDPTGFTHPLTLTLYNVDNSGLNPAVGSQISTRTVTAHVPWTPGQPWTAPDNNQYNGLFFTVDFDFTADNIVLPSQLIYGLSYNTQTWGASPIGVDGPYNSLNFALSSHPGQPTVGTNVEPDAVFWDTDTASWYADNGAGGVGIFRRDTQWLPYTPAVEFYAAVPEASAFMFAGLALSTSGLLTARHCRRNRKAKA